MVRLRCGAAEGGDGAEAAGAVAPLGHLHVGPGRGGCRSRQVEEVEGGRRRGSAGLAAEGHGHGVGEAGDGVDLRKGGGELRARPLGEAPGDDQAGALAAGVRQREDRVDRLLAGLLDEGAGVDDHEVGVGGVVDRLHAVGQQLADQLVGVDLVLRAAERLDEEAAAHDHPGYRGCRGGAEALERCSGQRGRPDPTIRC